MSKGITRKARIHVDWVGSVLEELDTCPDGWKITGYPDPAHVDVEVEFEEDSEGEEPGTGIRDEHTGVMIFEWL